MHDDTERLAYSPAEAGQIIGVSRAHIYELMNAGQLRSLKLGTRRLIRRSDLVALLEGAEHHPAA